MDLKNGTLMFTQTIGGISWNSNNGQLRCNFSSRSSQEGFVFRSNEHDIILEGMKKKYLRLPPQRIYISSSLSEGRTEQFVPGFCFIVRACHVHPTGYYSLGLYCVELLFGHFGFSAYDMASVMFSIKVTTPNSFLFLSIATNVLIYKYNKNTLPWRGDELGYQLQLLLFIIKERYLQIKQRSKRWERFKDQRPKQIYSRKEITNGSIETCKLSLWLYLNEATRPKKEKRAAVIFSKAIKFDKIMLTGSGDLMAQHSVVSLAILGFYPSWIRTYGIIKPGSISVKYLNRAFNLEKRLTAMECPIFLRTMLYFLKEQFPDDYFDLSVCENFVCKFSQAVEDKKPDNTTRNKHKKGENRMKKRKRTKPSKQKEDEISEIPEKRYDLFLPEQPLFDVADETNVHFGTETKNIPNGSLIQRYAFGNQKMLSIEEISRKCGLPHDVSSLKSFTIETEIWNNICNPVYPIEHNFYDEIHHTLKRLPKMSLDARAFADYVLSDLNQGELGDVVSSFVTGNTE